MKITIYLPVLLTQKELAIRYGNGVGLAFLQTQIDSLSTKDLIKKKDKLVEPILIQVQCIALPFHNKG